MTCLCLKWEVSILLIDNSRLILPLSQECRPGGAQEEREGREADARPTQALSWDPPSSALTAALGKIGKACDLW